MKQKVSVLLLLVLLLGSFSACGGGTEPPPATSTPSSVPTEAGSEAAPTEGTDATEATVRVMMQARSEGPISNDLPIVKEISEKAGIHFEWELAPADQSQYVEKFNILLASGNIPDIMNHHDMNVLNTGGRNGVYVDIKPYLESDMPNLTKLMAERSELERDIMTDDGNIYYLPRLTAVRTMNMFLVRQDIIEKENLTIPQTTEDMYEFLKFFKEYDLNGNAEADEIPWTCRNKFSSLNGFFEPFGMYLSDEFYVDDAGKVGYTFANEGFQQGLEYTAKLYAEELIDLEFSTNDIKVWDSRLSNEVSAVTWDSFVRVDYLNNLVTQVNPEAVFSSIPPLANAAGEHITKEQQNKYGKGSSISTSSPYVKEIVQFFDWIHSEEGHEIMNFGVEGETFTKENGAYQYTDLVMADPNNSGLSKLNLLGFRDLWPYRTDIAYENSMNSTYQNTLRDEYDQYVLGSRFPTTLTFTEAEQEVINSQYQEIKTYKDEMIYKFVMGIEPLTSYEEYVSNLNKMGIEDVIAVQQAAYDRYLAR